MSPSPEPMSSSKKKTSPKLKMPGPLCNQTVNLKTDSKTLPRVSCSLVVENLARLLLGASVTVWINTLSYARTKFALQKNSKSILNAPFHT